MQWTLRLVTLVGVAVSATLAVNLSPFVDISDLNTQWQSFGSSSGKGEECLRSIERAKALTSASLKGFEPTHYSCSDVKSLCSACASCSHFTATASATEKNCICATAATAASTTLSGKDDCFILADPMVALTDVNGGAGDDCFIGVQNDVATTTAFNGDAGDDIFLLLNNDKPDDFDLDLDGGLGDDCFYFGVIPVTDDAVTNSADGGDGNDFFFVDTNVEGPAGLAQHIFRFFGDGGNDLLVNHGRGAVELTFYGGADDDIIVQSSAQFNGIYAGDGDDKIIVSGTSLRGSDIAGELGSDIIIIRSGIVEEVYGGTYDRDNADDGADLIYVESSAIVGVIYGDGGDDYIHVSGRVRSIYGDDGDDEIILSGSHNSNSYVAGGDGNDRVYVYGGLHQRIDLSEGNNYLYVDSDGRVDSISGGAGDDVVILNGRAKYVYVGSGNNRVELGSSAVAYDVEADNAGAGYNQFVIAGRVDNYLNGGAGIDNIVVESSGQAAFVNAFGENDIIEIKGRALQVAAGDGDDVIAVSGNAGRVLGGAGSDIIQFSQSGKAPAGVDAGGQADVCTGPKGLVVVNCAMLSLTTSSSSSSSSSTSSSSSS